MTHPNIESITAYLASPHAEEFKQLSLHLAACGECRSQVGALSTLRDNFADMNVELYGQATEGGTELAEVLEQQLIEHYVDDQLQGEEKQRIAALLQKDPQALKAALHYASHSSSMQRELPEFNKVTITDQTKADQTGLRQGQNRSGKPALTSRLKDWFYMQTRVWITVPITAAAAATLAILLIPASGVLTIASYQDNPVIQFEQKNQLPGIGFFSAARKTVEPFGKVKIELLGKGAIALSWVAVEGAESYTVRLQMFANGQKISVGENTTTATRIEFEGMKFEFDHRYEWVLSGKTADAKTFHTSGGFVITRNNE